MTVVSVTLVGLTTNERPTFLRHVTLEDSRVGQGPSVICGFSTSNTLCQGHTGLFSQRSLSTRESSHEKNLCLLPHPYEEDERNLRLRRSDDNPTGA